MDLKYVKYKVTANSPREAFKLARKYAFDNHGIDAPFLKKDSYRMTIYHTVTNKKQLQTLIKNTLDSTFIPESNLAGCIRISDNPKTYLFYCYVCS